MVLKYPFKPADTKTWDYADIDTFNEFMKGKRLYRTFGSWYGDTMVTKDHLCPSCGGYKTLKIPEYEFGDCSIHIYNDFTPCPYPNNVLSDYG